MSRTARVAAQAYVRWLVLAAVVVAGGLGAYVVYRQMRPRVTVTEVSRKDVVQAFYATGTVSPEREYPVRTSTAGTLAEVYVDKGDVVKRGQALARVSEPDLASKVTQAEAEVGEKRARADEASSPVLKEFAQRIRLTRDLIETAEREVNRLRRLLETNAASQTDFDRALDRFKQVSLDLAAAESQRETMRLELQRELQVAGAVLDAAEENASRQTLASPIDGVVLDRPVARGTRLAVNDHVMRVADVRPGKLVMRAAVDEEDITKVRVDPADPQGVHMTLYAFSPRPGERDVEQRVFEGRVRRKYDQADPDRRTFEVDVSLPADETRFQPGMTGELAFVMQSKRGVPVVPSQAVQNGTLYAVRGGRLARTDATLGVSGVERVEVLAGVAPGDKVVISPIGGLAEGQWVRETFMDPDTAAGLNKPKTRDIFRGGF